MNVEIDLGQNRWSSVRSRAAMKAYGTVETLNPSQNRPDGRQSTRRTDHLRIAWQDDLADTQWQVGDEEDTNAGKHENEHLILQVLLSRVASIFSCSWIGLHHGPFARTNTDHDVQ